MKVKVLVYFFLLFVTSIGTTLEYGSLDDGRAPFELIMENQTTCVKQIINNRVYLNEDQIAVTGNGILLILNDQGEYLYLPELLSDSSGCFLTVPEKVMVTKICRGCKREYFLWCKNPDCPLKKKPK